MSKIVVAGSLHYDIFVESPFRPAKGETVLGYKWYPKFGGKGGNQALACAKSGGEVVMVSAVGSDSFADPLLNILHKNNINSDFVQRCEHIKSGMSVAIADDDGDYGAVVVSGANLYIDNSVFSNKELFCDAKMLILQNEVMEETNIAAAKSAKENNVIVCVNAAPARKMSEEFTSLIDILIVNAVEAQGFCNVCVDSLQKAEEAAKELHKKFKCVIVTAGGDGVAYCDDFSFGSVASEKVNVISTHGAGDCFVGNLCVQLCNNKSIEEAIKLANHKAALHVSTVQEENNL